MRRQGISSIYGFIMIFLLSMASLQVWSTAVGSMTAIQDAADESHQLQQMQGLERLSLSVFQGNVTITNDGQVPSTVEYLRLSDGNDSFVERVAEQIPVGGSLHEPVRAGYTVEAVTSLGNVFTVSGSSQSPLSVFAGGASGSNAELFQDPGDASIFFMSAGPEVYELGAAGVVWSFDAELGYVTDVMPLSDGDVYVSVGYAFPSNLAELYELGPAGNVLASSPVRVDQSDNNPSQIQTPVPKGVTPKYAFYDGGFYSGMGYVSGATSDSYGFAASDQSNFYLYETYASLTLNGTCPQGNEVRLVTYAPSPTSNGPALSWERSFYLSTCSPLYPQFVSGAAGGGLVASLFTQEAYVGSGGLQYPGTNASLIVAQSSGLGPFLYQLPEDDYTSVATDGSRVYLALPATGEVQVFNTATEKLSTYDVGFPASQLVWAYGSLFAISQTGVKVYGSGMALEDTISFAPQGLASFSNGFPLESTLHAPSFLPLNSSAYAALLENSTGYVSLAVGSYT